MSADLPVVRSSTELLDRQAASRDLWPLGTLAAWQGREVPLPERVFWPSNVAEVSAVLGAANAQEIAVVPYGAGSGVCGGAQGRSGSWVLDTKRLARIGPLDPDRWTVHAEAGVIGQHLEDWLDARGFTLGHSPSSIACSTVGGWAAARGAGQFSSRYGVFEDMVLGLRAVCPGVGVFRVGPTGDAPDHWMELILGSEGTLAVVTDLELRVWPAPAARWLRGYRFPDVPTALRAMRRLMQGELHPSVVRLYDPVDTRIGGRTRPATQHAPAFGWLRRALAAIDAVPALRRRSLALPLALPGLVNRVFDGIASGCLLIVGWEGSQPVVDACSEVGHRILTEEGADLGAEPGARWYAERHAVSYKLMPVFERGGFADTMEVAARWSRIIDLYAAVRAALRPTAVVMAHMSHVYPEGACIYFSFAGLGDPRRYRRTWQAAMDAALAAGGTLSHHHGIGALKAGHAVREIGPAVAGWRALKQRLDPGAIMNPGRLYREAEVADGGPPPELHEDDGLARSPVGASLDARRAVAEPMWPWAVLPAPPRWQRLPWQTPWVEVSGVVGGMRAVLGRGPRSAVGADLRGWLAAADPDATATWAVADDGDRWLGQGTPTAPWRAAQEILRTDLRPAVLTVEGGCLFVGFRGPAAAALGRVAAERVQGGLEEVAWRPFALPAGPLDPCDVDDPDCIHVTPQSGFRKRT